MYRYEAAAGDGYDESARVYQDRPEAEFSYVGQAFGEA